MSHDVEPLIEMAVQWATDHGLVGQARYCFALGEAIVYLQEAGGFEILACRLALKAVNRFREGHPVLFRVPSKEDK